MAKYVRPSIAAGLVALSLVTGIAANAQASTEISAHQASVSSKTTGVATPNLPRPYSALEVSASLASELLSGPIAGALVGTAFILVGYYTDGGNLPVKHISDAEFQRTADADFDSELGTAS